MTTGASLFAGIGGFDLAMERLGVNVTFAAEIDNNCRAKLGEHFPNTKIVSDVKEVTASDILATGFNPEEGILTGGWPCQGNSVAGLRQGLADPRSGLWRELTRILGDLQPRWFIGENVPGLLTVRGGADFYEVIKSLDDLGYGVAWRVLDAQYIGVPQRRRRVLIAGCLGDAASAAQVLLEPERRSGDLATRPQAWPRVAGTLASSAGSGGLGGVGQSANSITSRLIETVSTLQGGGRRGYRVDAESAAGGHLRVAHTLTAGVAAKPGVNPPGRRQEDDFNLVATYTKRTNAHGPAGTDQADEHWIESGVSPTLSHFDVAESRAKVICVTGDVTHTLRAEGADASEDGTGRGTPMVAYALSSHHSRADREQTWVPTKLGVRRLTPLECERLQGFPDGWTAGQSDSARYRQLGNAVAVPVVEWVMRRVVSNP